MKKSTIATKIILFIGIAIFANLIAYNAFFRLDFTADGRYSLSKSTQVILSDDFDEVVNITAYFSKNLPTAHEKIKREFKNKLVEYQNESGGNMVYKFEDPADDYEADEQQKMIQEMAQKGIPTFAFTSTEKDEVTQKVGYMAVEISYGDQTEIIQQVQSESSIEYQLTKAIAKLIAKDKPKVAVLEGHATAGLDKLIQLKEQLDIQYEVQAVLVSDSTPLDLNGYSAVIIIDPKDSIPPSHFQALNDFLSNGGGIMLCTNSIQLQQQQGQFILFPAADTGLSEWLADKGIYLGENVVSTADCATMNVPVQAMQGFTMSMQRKVPYVPLVKDFGDHISSTGLEAVVFQFATSLTYSAKEGISYSPLAMTHELSASEKTPALVDFNKEWVQSDFTEGSKVMALAAEGTLSGQGLGKLVVISDGGFVVNENNQGVTPDNVNLVSNSVDWLTGKTGLIELRTKEIVYRPLDTEGMSDMTRESIKAANMVAPVILLLLFGLYRRVRNTSKRSRWKQGKF